MNLAQFKKRLAEICQNGGTVDFSYKSVTTFAVTHPFHAQFPEGKTEERNATGCKIGRVQSNSFTRVLDDGRESWMDFGKAGDWEFPDEHTAINCAASYKGTDHEHFATITYKF